MERVLRGDDYYYFYHNSLFICVDCDFRNTIDDARYEIGNYFRTKEEAEAMAEKIRKVLEGADVIEMPSEGDIKAIAIRHCGPLAQWSGSTVDAFIECAEWLKSKIVK